VQNKWCSLQWKYKVTPDFTAEYKWGFFEDSFRLRKATIFLKNGAEFSPERALQEHHIFLSPTR